MEIVEGFELDAPYVTTMSRSEAAKWMHTAIQTYMARTAAIVPPDRCSYLAKAFNSSSKPEGATIEQHMHAIVHAAASVFAPVMHARVRMMLMLRDFMVSPSAAHLAAQYAVDFWRAEAEECAVAALCSMRDCDESVVTAEAEKTALAALCSLKRRATSAPQ